MSVRQWCGWCGHGPADPVDLSTAMRDVLGERKRQRDAEGFDLEHDDGHDNHDLAWAGIAYAMNAASKAYPGFTGAVGWWPFDMAWWKPKDRRRDLVRGAALLLAEIERLDRAAAKGGAA